MAHVKLNSSVAEIRGAVGGIVYKRHGNRTIASKYPDMSGIKRSPKQKLQIARMTRAALFYHKIQRSPALQQHYTALANAAGITLYRLATREYMRRAKETGQLIINPELPASSSSLPPNPTPAPRNFSGWCW
jgi:hypothetical protein